MFYIQLIAILLYLQHVTAETCTGTSNTLNVEDCSSWIQFYDVTDLKTNNKCRSARTDPCSCNSTAQLNITCTTTSIKTITASGIGIDCQINAAWIPLSKLSGLRQLDLSNNKFTGTLSSTNTMLSTDLNYLDLSSNQITGNIPTKLGILTDLSYLNISHNQFFGTIDTLSTLTDLISLDLSFNQLSGLVKTSTIEPNFFCGLTIIVHLDLTRNNFSGPVPVFNCGVVHHMKYMRLNDNQFNSLPPTLAQMNQLIELRLQSNYLSGKIPNSLVQLNELNILQLNDNQLTGRLPSLPFIQYVKYCALNNNNFTCPLPNNTQECQQGPPTCSKSSKIQTDQTDQTDQIDNTHKKIFIDNTQPKLDIHGNIVNAHDGTYRYWQGNYYYHGAEYGLCREPLKNGCDQTANHCGFHNNHNVSIWKSKDLSSGSWTRIGTAVQCTELENCGILYRPHLVFNPTTKLFVLFVNFVSKTNTYGGNAVYSSSTPEGPFVLRTKQMALSRLCPGPAIPTNQTCGPTQGGCGDFDVFVDDDGKGYIVYGCNYWMSIEPLTMDFYDSISIAPGTRDQNYNATGPNFKFNGTVFPDYFVEAPTLFKRQDVYYLLYGHCCCFCYQGSGILVYTSSNVNGPWVVQPGGDLACIEGATEGTSSTTTERNAIEFVLQQEKGSGHSISAEPTPGQGCLYGGSIYNVSTTHAQQNFVMQIRETDQFLWTGDLWQQSPDGLKGHEGQYWTLLEFDENGRVGRVLHQDNFTMYV
jgi:Leucine-rich repeat (LRR) protein